MRLISHQQRAKLRVRFEIASSALASLILVTAMVVISTPGYGIAAVI